MHFRAMVQTYQKNPTDVADKANVRIYQFHGFSATGAPGSYPGGSTVIDPADSNIVWNATNQWWEVTFDVTGFSGFFVSNQGNITAVPNVPTGRSLMVLHPNPAKGFVLVDLPASSHNTQLNVIDITGRIVKIIPIGRNTLQKRIDLDDVRPGVYELVWYNENGRITQALIVH